MKRDFAEWLLTFTDSIADYKYYIDFETIYKNAEKHKIELNIMNSLIGSKNIEKDFENLAIKYPEIIKCIPTLLAVRQYEILVLDDLKYIREIQSYLTLNDDLRAPSLEADSVSTNNLDSIDLVLHNYNNREESKFTLDDLKYLHNIQSMLTDSSLTLDYTGSLGGSASLNANLIEKLINLSDGQTYETLVNINNKLTEITNSVNNLLEVVNSYDTSITDLNDNVVFGVYDGDGTEDRLINLGFKPAAVEIF